MHCMINLQFVALLFILALTGSTAACLWDYDTLRTEAKGLPGIAEIITGRFERNPPLYYEMRLERSAQAVTVNPLDWDAYDNAGVACDRLGRYDEAIAWMERKAAALDGWNVDESKKKESRYRQIANLGTFYAHRWIAQGRNRDDLADLRRGIELIEAAIALNPDAHFGREKYQLMVMRWLLNPPGGQGIQPPPLFWGDPNYVAFVEDGEPRPPGGSEALKKLGYHDAVEGLTGLIALGTAWESIDVYHTLAYVLSLRSDTSLAKLVRLRLDELVTTGHRSLHPNAATGTELLADMSFSSGRMVASVDEIQTYYERARAHTEAWHEARTQFMLARLKQGKHPDVDADFWQGYEEAAPIALPNGIFGISPARFDPLTIGLIVALIAVPCLYVLLRLIKWYRRPRLLNQQA